MQHVEWVAEEIRSHAKDSVVIIVISHVMSGISGVVGFTKGQAVHLGWVKSEESRSMEYKGDKIGEK
ncbi:hypothetical protein V6N13_021728 [Hibiscus sabdariffa]|uniref:Uncharacterized protein n=1 Tax=Hibiscus sabdariffa TaxID=183260 RepID=A0ABR2BA99_9ROSI